MASLSYGDLQSKTYGDLANLTYAFTEISNSDSGTYTIPSYKFFRLIKYEFAYDQGNHVYEVPDTLRFFIYEDAHLRDHAQLNGLDIFFVDLSGRFMPCELVYYGNGTGEWWLKPSEYDSSITIQEIANMNLTSQFVGGSWTTHSDALLAGDPGFFMVYGDRTDPNHVEATVDPTSRIWCTSTPNAVTPSTPVVAHSSFFLKNSLEPNWGFPYECSITTPEARPVNSVLYTGHVSGWTSVDSTPVSANTTTLLDKLRNACCISPYTDRNNSTTAITTTIPLYSFDNATGQITDDGSVTTLVFCIGTGRATTTRNSALFGYRDMIVVLREYYYYDQDNDISESHWELKFFKAYSYTDTETGETRIGWSCSYSSNLPDWSGIVGYLCFYNSKVDCGFLAHVVENTDNLNSSSTYTYTTPSVNIFQDAIYLSSSLGTSNSYPEDCTYIGALNDGSYSLLEIRSDIPITSIDNYGNSSLNEQQIKTFWKLIFDNESLRTVGDPILSSQYSDSMPNLQWLFNRTKIYQGLAGGCN